MSDIRHYEKMLLAKGYHHIAGTDEVGRGPMAGPIVAAAVVLPPDCMIEGINDSKKLTSNQRIKLNELIHKHAIEVKITFIDVETVDRINVYQASKLAMIKSISGLRKVDYILSDAMKLNLDVPCLDIIKGDTKSISIAAASIVAKVARDNYMIEIDKKYPNYGFKNHKGYVTKAHIQAINEYGITKIHRRSFAPVKNVINQQLSFDI